jgi:hypothetical protein
MFYPTVRKPKCSQVFSETSYFYDLDKIRTFVFANCIFWGIGTDLFKTHTTGSVAEKPAKMVSVPAHYRKIIEGIYCVNKVERGLLY